MIKSFITFTNFYFICAQTMLKLFFKTNYKEKSLLSYASLAQGQRVKGVLMAQP